MKKRLFPLGTLLVVLLAVTGLLLAQSNPFVGTWKLNPAKSKYTSGAPAKEETVMLETVGDQDQLTAKGTAADGSPISIKYEVPNKGGKGKILSGGPYDGVSGKVVDDNTRDVTYMKGGKDMMHIHAAVSKDGKTMRVTAKGTDAQGKPVSGVSVWEKQ